MESASAVKPTTDLNHELVVINDLVDAVETIANDKAAIARVLQYVGRRFGVGLVTV